MQFVLGNRVMTTVGGTEVHVLTLAMQLLRLGHGAVIYSPELGAFSDYARTQGVDVMAELRQLPESCDVVFAQDTIVAYDLAGRYPEAVQVFRVCGDVFDFQQPPQLPGVADLIVVLSGRYERLARACAVSAPVVRLRVPIDIDRLVPVGPLRERPRRAVLLGNYPDRDSAVRAAWEPLGVEVSRIGLSAQRFDLAAALAGVDVVVAKARAALDGMACGRAVYVFDIFGGDGWVTPANYHQLERDNFAGQATARVIDAAALSRDLSAYDARMGASNRDLVVQHHNARDHAIALLAAIGDDVRQPRERSALGEIARLTTLQWAWERTVRDHQRALADAHGRVIESERRAELDRAQAERMRQADDQRRHEEAGRLAAQERALGLEGALTDARREVDRLLLERDRALSLLADVRASRAWWLATRWYRLKRRLRSLRGNAAVRWMVRDRGSV